MANETNLNDANLTDNPEKQSQPPNKRGPKTPEGKRRSSLNARRHLITSKVMIAAPDEMAAYEAHCKAYREALAPVGTLEIELVEEICADKFRLKRARALENSIFALGHDRYAETLNPDPQIGAALAEGMTWIREGKNLQLLSIYESRIRKSIEKNMAELKALQVARKEAYARAQREAIKLVKVAVNEGHDYEPGNDFEPASAHGEFVFSNSELARVIDRANRISRSLDLPDLKLKAA